jgi:hypothetical protein
MRASFFPSISSYHNFMYLDCFLSGRCFDNLDINEESLVAITCLYLWT